MNVVAIVQARMGSTRLPGKVLVDISGKPMLAHVIGQLKRCQALEKIVVAMSGAPEDQDMVHVIDAFGVEWVRGNKDADNDVLGRYVLAARRHEADLIVRVTADCPLIDPGVVDHVIETIQARPYVDYCSNVLLRSYPRGLDCEAFWLDTLLRLDRHCVLPRDREHVTRYIRMVGVDPGELANRLFTRYVVEDSEDNSDLRWTIDTADDLAAMRRIYKRLAPDCTPYHELVRQVRADPDLVWLDR